LFPVGTPVTIAVLEEGKPQTSIEAKVGDNLRQVLLDNKIEVYKGLKKKLGNCGGGGQCTFCAAEFVESEGWEPRSDYENQKLKKNPNARLTCLNNIQGPATIKI
jgi:ferredoxin